jgi:hypothetical protein
MATGVQVGKAARESVRITSRFMESRSGLAVPANGSGGFTVAVRKVF